MLKETRIEYIKKMEAFAETVTTILKNGLFAAHAAMQWYDILPETERIRIYY